MWIYFKSFIFLIGQVNGQMNYTKVNLLAEQCVRYTRETIIVGHIHIFAFIVAEHKFKGKLKSLHFRDRFESYGSAGSHFLLSGSLRHSIRDRTRHLIFCILYVKISQRRGLLSH